MRIVITGAGGFIGSHLAKRLKGEGHEVIGIDIKKNEHWPPTDFESFFDQFHVLDLRWNQFHVSDLRWNTMLLHEADRVYHLAANMGGIGFIETNKAEIVRDNTLIDINTIELARLFGARRFLYTSSACVYPGYRQKETAVVPLKEEDAYPADAEDGYGWQKLSTERICRHYREDFGLDTRIVRLHNVFGPQGTWGGGREKAPAAICRKVAESEGGIEIWGDGKQTRSFLYVDDCVDGLIKVMESTYTEPLNLGQGRLVNIDGLVTIVEGIAGKKLVRRYKLDAAQGVRGRNSDSTRIMDVTGWRPKITLEEGLEKTYRFILDEML